MFANLDVHANCAFNYRFWIFNNFMINADGSPNTAHTTNPVPLFLIDADYKKINNGLLSDLAPTVLKIMGLEIPKEMTGKVLV